MFGHGKCPKCSADISQCDLDKIVIGDQFAGPFFHGVSMCCPKCKTVLGVSADPEALAQDIVQKLFRRIEKNK
jgi:phage FluMu protein Com